MARQAHAKLNAMASLQQWSGTIFKELCFALLAITVLGARSEANEKPAPAPKELRTDPRQLCVGLQWESIPGSKAYELQRAQTPNGPFKTLPNKLPQLTIYNDFIGKGGADFYYRVRSLQTNGAGSSFAFGLVEAGERTFRCAEPGPIAYGSAKGKL